MNKSLLMRTVVCHLARYRLRTSLLTAAICATVIVTATIRPLAAGARGAFRDYAERVYPADVVVLSSGGFVPGGPWQKSLTIADVDTVRAASPEIVAWDPVVRVGPRELGNAGRLVSVGIVGHSAAAPAVRRRGALEGEFFDAADVQRRSRVALLGPTTARSLYADASPVGREVHIDRVPFEIVGVLEPAGADPHGADLDATVWIPYTTAMDELLGVDSVSEVAFALADARDSEAVARRIEEVMRERHAIREGYDDDFSVVTPVVVAATLEQAFSTMSLFVAAVVGLISAVAGVVVLGVLTMSVKQRSVELALRKAFGARPAHLAAHFALEVLGVTLVACLIGVAAAFAILDVASPVLAGRFGMTGVELSASAAAVSVGAAALTAGLGGIAPVVRAARLDAARALG